MSWVAPTRSPAGAPPGDAQGLAFPGWPGLKNKGNLEPAQPQSFPLWFSPSEKTRYASLCLAAWASTACVFLYSGEVQGLRGWGDIARWEKCLLCMCEDPSRAPQDPCKSWVPWDMAITHNSRSRDRWLFDIDLWSPHTRTHVHARVRTLTPQLAAISVSLKWMCWKFNLQCICEPRSAKDCQKLPDTGGWGTF